MSLNGSPIKERRLSVNNRNAYIVLNSEHNKEQNKNIDDSMLKKQFLSATTNTGFSASTSAPQLNEFIFNDKINKIASPTVSKETINNKSNTTKPTTTKSTNRVLTGMDRYITITKRKSSPQSAKFQPSSKQPKNAAASQNRFALLDNAETAETAAVSTNKFKPPPLYLREATTNELVSMLTQALGKENFYVTSLKKGNVLETKIQVNSETVYRKLVNCLDSEKRSYYTYQLKSAKGLIVVIKGIDSAVPVNDLQDALEKEGYEVKSIHNILNRNKIPQPMFRVEITFNSSQIKTKGEPHPIYGLRYLLNRRIVVEEPIKRKGPPQCQNCQEFGHTKSFCKLPSVCVRCGDIHKSLDCPHAKNDAKVLKCSNCGGNHTANYRGCEVYLRLKQKSAKKPVYDQYRNTALQNRPPTMQQQNSRETNVNQQQLSYAQTLKKGTAASANLTSENNHEKNSTYSGRFENNQSSIDKLIQTMDRFMASMESMFQQMLQNQSMLMQILLNKK